MDTLFAPTVRLPGRWATDVRITLHEGRIAAIDEGAAPQPGDERFALVLPGMVNLHSHAFQRALAGQTEVASPGGDDFWSWRQSMYRFMAKLSPADVEAIAAQLYVENLAHGYTAVVEFHYLHNDPNGVSYANRVEMAERILAAHERSGIALTLLPVLYAHGGFGARPLDDAQRRFAGTVDDVLAMHELLAARVGADTVLGLAPHSLRAASAGEIRALAAAAKPGTPLHIHAAEQAKEVDDCLAATGKRPLRLLLDEVGLDSRWCVVHATHLTEDEVRDLAGSGAVVGLCPTTEADLGDGVFPLVEFVAAGGRFGIGGDSHVCRSPFAELRLLEYAQRLTRRRRNLALHRAGTAIADVLWDAAARGGAQAAGRDCGAIAAGRRADLIAVALDDPAASAYSPRTWLSQAVFGGSPAHVTDAWVGGRRVLHDGSHPRAGEIAERYRTTMARLLA